jgi:hypothetical protein
MLTCHDVSPAILPRFLGQKMAHLQLPTLKCCLVDLSSTPTFDGYLYVISAKFNPLDYYVITPIQSICVCLSGNCIKQRGIPLGSFRILLKTDLLR